MDVSTMLGFAGAAFGTMAVVLAVLMLLGPAWSMVALFAALSTSCLWLGHVNR